MRILMLSDLENEGGAAVSASRLATSLRRAGESVTRIVARRGAAPDESTLAIRSALRVPTRLAIPSVVALARRIRHRSAERRLASTLRDQRPDVVSIHNLHNASTFGWSFRFVELAAAVAPVFVTLHDMWSFTGRCAYNGACRRFESECDAGCPTPGEYPAWPSRGIASEHRLRRAVLDAHPTITAIAPSRWIAAEARRGLWRTHSVEVVPYGVDLSIFRPMPRSVARQRLGIPQDVPVVLFAVHHFADKRKGSPFLVEVMRRMSRPAAFLAMGSGARRLSGVIPLGWIGPDEQKALVYNAADLMVHAATEDNLPNTVIEAIACGTPVAAFNAGGIGEIVRPGVSGWLSPEMSGAALAETVDAAVRSIAAGDDLRASARKHAEKNYDSGREAQRYLELFSGRTHSAS